MTNIKVPTANVHEPIRTITDVGQGWKFITHTHWVTREHRGLARLWRRLLRKPLTYQEQMVASVYVKPTSDLAMMLKPQIQIK